jgi:membrane protein DedA with SNARE-associated domain
VSLESTVEDLVRSYGYPALAGVVLMENLFPPIPSEVVLPLAGYQVSRGVLGFGWSVVAATIGSVVGALLLYWLGRRGGRPAVLRYGRVLRVTDDDLDRADAWMQRRGAWAVLLGRMVPGLRSIVSIPAGVLCMPMLRFTVLTTVGSAVWNAALIAAGVALGSAYSRLSGPISAAALVVLAVAAVAAFFFIRRWRRRRQGESTMRT